jgi:hypothetical protein
VATRRESLLLKENAQISGITFSPDGKWLVTGAITEGFEGGGVESAGQNRHGVADARAAR